ncbi:adenylate kinase [candidate division WOR-3 bacterium]|nr:adenylate kinase [candidate division WOR-3 bacterium]
MILLLLGPPGVGKGTQADLIAQHYALTTCSTGNMLREEISRNTELGAAVKQYLEKGVLVPDSQLFTLVEHFLAEHMNGGLLFDGFPRNVNQARVFETLLNNIDLKLDMAIDLHLSENDIVERLAHRRYCSKCGRTYNLITNPPKENELCDTCHIALMRRTDDTENVIRRRMEIYTQETYPLITYYTSQGKYHQISAQGTKQEIFARITNIINGNKA